MRIISKIAVACSLLLISVGAQAKSPCAPAAPYAVSKRPLPTGSTVVTVLPSKVGKFVRDSIPQSTAIPSDEDFNTTYKAGNSEVFVGLSRPGSVKDVQEGVRVTHQEAVADRSIDRTGERLCIGSDMSFYKLKNFYSWSRGDYFFYAQASDSKALDAFMAAFPH
jgi:hypothetical protein